MSPGNDRAFVKPFLDEDFLLDSSIAARPLSWGRRPQPILDYHCHLSPEQVADNHRFRSLTEIWLDGDHYKWRAMRADGVPERLITGEALGLGEVPGLGADGARTRCAIRSTTGRTWSSSSRSASPASCWGPTPRARSSTTATRSWRPTTSPRRASCASSTSGVVCSTDDPMDDLEPHLAARPQRRGDHQALPDLAARTRRWRSTTSAAGTAGSTRWTRPPARPVGTLATRSWTRSSSDTTSFTRAAVARPTTGSIASAPPTTPSARSQAIFAKARGRQALTPDEIEKLRSALLYDFAVIDHPRGWVQQFHLGALRNNSTRALRALGPDTGFDSIGDLPQAARWRASSTGSTSADQLAKTILYNLNPADNEAFATVIGNFQDGSAPGKMQFGSAWWFLDQLDGMEKQMNALSNMGLLSRFVGHADRLAQLPVVLAPRVLPAPALQHARATTSSAASCPTTARSSARWSRTSASGTRATTSASKSEAGGGTAAGPFVSTRRVDARASEDDLHRAGAGRLDGGAPGAVDLHRRVVQVRMVHPLVASYGMRVMLLPM